MTVNQIGNNPWRPGIVQDVYVPDQLVSGPLQLVTDTKTITGGKVYKRGTVLGVVTASGRYQPSVKTATDGSEVPSAILVDDVDATAGDVLGGVYLMGEFNGHRIIIDNSWTVETVAQALRPSSIFIRDVVKND
ncbi:head decoration protein [Enterobacter asburiae]|uniref:head decoration protein n=1 Tax=Enterobacter asburiae TaxID=61645 RepID=UPI001CFBF99B|nr:head decoration protein [Enterobacter asburiae]MCB4615333.1 head decoration protein [Enterobacter asburiae]